MPKQWVSKPQKHRDRWRLDVGVGAIRTGRHPYGTLEEAEAARKRFLRAFARDEEERSAAQIENALQSYRDLQLEKGNKERTVETEMYRIVHFFGRSSGDLPRIRSKDEGEAAYRRLREATTRYGRPPSVAEHRACLAAAKRFGAFLVASKLWARNPLLEVSPIGRSKKGEESKPQLRADEAARFASHCIEVALRGDDNEAAGATAALVDLLCDLRCSEIVTRQVRDLDGGGTLLWVPTTKTESGRRVMCLVSSDPEEENWLAPLRAALQRQARGKTPLAPLIGIGHTRHWVGYWVRKLCVSAGVPKVVAHALRATHASLAIEQGSTPSSVARAMGHAGPAITLQHYATQASQSTGQRKRVLALLSAPESHSPTTPPGSELDTNLPGIVVGARGGS